MSRIRGVRRAIRLSMLTTLKLETTRECDREHDAEGEKEWRGVEKLLDLILRGDHR
jgi:hypothetical protein